MHNCGFLAMLLTQQAYHLAALTIHCIPAGPLLQPAYNTRIQNADGTVTLWYKRGVLWQDKWVGNYDAVATGKPDYARQVGLLQVVLSVLPVLALSYFDGLLSIILVVN